MAVTKILARHARLDLAINYAVNPDKTDEEVLTAYLNCDKGHACHQMLATKEAKNNRDGVQYYHIIQSFKPGEITPELALEIAQAFAKEHLSDYEVVIGVHVDKEHIHAHMIFNSHIARIQSTRDSLLCTTITAICLDASRSGSIRRA